MQNMRRFADSVMNLIAIGGTLVGYLLSASGANAITVEIGISGETAPGFSQPFEVIGSGSGAASGSYSILSGVSGQASGQSLTFPNILTASFSADVAFDNAAPSATFWVTITGLTAGGEGGATLLESQLNNLFVSSAIGFSTLTAKTFLDATNVAFGTGTPLSSQPVTAFSGANRISTTQLAAATLVPGSLYSVTTQFTLNAGRASRFSGTVDIGFVPTPAAPIPAALPLFAAGLGGLGLLGWRRKRKARVSLLGAARPLHDPQPHARGDAPPAGRVVSVTGGAAGRAR